MEGGGPVLRLRRDELRLSPASPFLPLVGAVDNETAKPGRLKSPGTTTDCNTTYLHNIGIRPKRADLAELNPVKYRAELGLAPGELEVLISCAPCTGFLRKTPEII